MWTYDGTQWTQITYNGVRPPKRAFGTMVYDAARQVMVLFGGRGDQAHQHSDTWEYDGVSWSQVSTAHIPPARKSHKMVYDRGLGASVIYGGSAGGVFSDVWRYDGIDWVEWRLESKLGHGTIKERFDHAMAYDEAHGKIIVFGGFEQDSNEYLNDTWSINTNNKAGILQTALVDASLPAHTQLLEVNVEAQIQENPADAFNQLFVARQGVWTPALRLGQVERQTHEDGRVDLSVTINEPAQLNRLKTGAREN